MAQTFIALGSNLGDRDANLHVAVKALEAASEVTLVQVSTFIETAAQGGPAQPDYLNAAAELRATATPRELLTLLLDIENCLGRVRNERWGPRTIDLDLLLYGRQVIRQPELEVPHPRMHRREFVLRPLCEIAPDLVHPVLGKDMRTLLEELNGSPPS